ncbi:double zinc ribbon domain-containing protein [Chlamydiales bacterium]|nr:double zinc ribbon domain-containing protein [Chlamydiales bacterium]
MTLDFFFPSFCPHCDEPKPQNKLLCTPCSEHIEITKPNLLPKGPFLDGIAYALENEGALHTLKRRFIYQEKWHLAKPFAHLLFLSLQQLAWPGFTKLIHLPLPLHKRLFTPYNPNKLLAESLSPLLSPSENDTYLLIAHTSKPLYKLARTLSKKNPKALYALSLTK